MQRSIDKVEEICAIGGEGGGGNFTGECGDDFGIDHAILAAGKPLGVGADEGGEAGVVGGFCVVFADKCNGGRGLTIGGPFE
jgi:hypothetical protein